MQVESTITTPLFACGLEVLELSSDSLSEEGLGSSRHLLCACYKLNEDTGVREGCIQSYIIDDEEDGSIRLVRGTLVSCPAGVLDFKVDGSHVATALSNGQCGIHRFSATSEGLQSKEVCQYSNEEEGLFLSVDFNCSLSSTQPESKVCVTTQASSVIVLDRSSHGLVEAEHKLSTHVLLGEPMPVWTVAMDKVHDPNRFITGGDDMIFRMWDLRCEAALSRNKFHSAGVTTAQWHRSHEHVFLTGSYDDQCCIWDTRRPSIPLHVINAGGGVWRAKWTSWTDHLSAIYPDCVLTTAMQAGCSLHRLASLGNDAVVPCLSQHFSDGSPQQLVYDVALLTKAGSASPRGVHLACCSFYDRSLYVLSAAFSEA